MHKKLHKKLDPPNNFDPNNKSTTKFPKYNSGGFLKKHRLLYCCWQALLVQREISSAPTQLVIGGTLLQTPPQRIKG